MQKIIKKFAQDEALAYHLYNMVSKNKLMNLIKKF